MDTITILKLNDSIYLLYDNEGSTGYVVLGTKKALVIDTMNGTQDIKQFVERITELPLMLVNTHGHPDHIGGNFFFDKAYIHPDDIELANDFLPTSQTGERKKMQWERIMPGEQIELGGLTLEVILLAGHTKGCIGLLDREHRILFSGDALNDHLWMQFDHCLSLREYLHTLQEVKKIRPQFDYLLSGHCTNLVDGSLVEELESAVIDMLQGKNEQDYPYEYFAGTVMAHPYDTNEPSKVIVYNPNRFKCELNIR